MYLFPTHCAGEQALISSAIFTLARALLSYCCCILILLLLDHFPHGACPYSFVYCTGTFHPYFFLWRLSVIFLWRLAICVCSSVIFLWQFWECANEQMNEYIRPGYYISVHYAFSRRKSGRLHWQFFVGSGTPLYCTCTMYNPQYPIAEGKLSGTQSSFSVRQPNAKFYPEYRQKYFGFIHLKRSLFLISAFPFEREAKSFSQAYPLFRALCQWLKDLSFLQLSSN